jgi:hypothetical protein
MISGPPLGAWAKRRPPYHVDHSGVRAARGFSSAVPPSVLERGPPFERGAQDNVKTER